MALQPFTNPGMTTKILHGNETDVSFLTIVKYGPDEYVFMGVTILESMDETHIIPDKRIVKTNLEQFTREFNSQLGTPMQYLSQEHFDWFIND